ncbi:MAG: SDR family oxidoreductase [Bdellovibrionota bacterium]
MAKSTKTTLITGASSGIGLELAHIFAREGDDLVLVARSENKLLTLKEELEKKHSIKVFVIKCDLSLPEAPSELISQIREKKLHIDHLVNNAGFGVFGDFATETDWVKEKEMIQVNIVALTELTKAFLPDMVKRSYGRVLNVASTAAFQPGPGMAIYFATKAYVLHFSEAIAEELRDTGVYVSALCPGATVSGFQNAAAMDESKLFKDKKLPSSQEVAEYGYASLMNGKRVAVHGLANYLLAQTVRISPRNLVTKITRKLQEKANESFC